MAARYWVGGTATWDGTAGTKWALTSGGAGGQAVPTSADTVFFDANSGAKTVTIGSGTSVCSTLTLTGFTGTLAFGTNSITVSGTNTTIFTGATTCTVTGTPLLICNGAGTSGQTRTIATTAVTEANTISFNITTGSDSVSITTRVKTLDFTGFTGSLANATFAIYGNLILSSGMTVPTGGLLINFSSTLVQQNITTNGVSIDRGFVFSGTNTYQLQDALTLTVARTVTLTSGTLDLNNKVLTTGAFSSSNTNTRSILFGTGNITLTTNNGTILAGATLTGFTYTGTPTINATYSGATGTRTFNWGNTAGGSETNAVSINISAGTDIVALSTAFLNLDFTGFAGTYSNNLKNIYGNLIISTGMTLTAGTLAQSFSGTRTQQNITSNGKTLDFPLTFGGTQTYQLQDALTSTSARTFSLTSGTIDLNGKTLTTGLFSITGATTRSISFNSGKIVILAIGTSWNVSGSNFTTSGSGTISMNNASGKTFAGGGFTYPTLSQDGAGALTITGANTFTTITNTVQPSTITLPTASTTTVTNFTVNGTAGNLVTLNSDVAGTQATLTKAGGGTVNVNYLSIQDSNATPGSTWNAANSVNVSNNTGWNFGGAVFVTNGLFFGMPF